MERFEYLRLILSNSDIDDRQFTKILNRYGYEGWELISILNQNGLGSTQFNIVGITQKNTLIFKRRVENKTNSTLEGRV